MDKYKTYAFVFLVLVSLFGLSLSHGHSHDDDDGHGHGHGHDEPPSFKWSRAANEDPILEEQDIPEEDIIDLPPQYGKEKPTAGHGHAHGGHGHAHGGHGHSHGGHGHSHGTPQREPTPEERAKHRAKLHREWDDDEDETTDQERFNLWVNALGSTLAISMAPFIILFFLNVDNSPEKSGLLKVLLAFASGGLLGDAFLHLIPHAIMAQDGHGHSHGGGGNDHGHTHGHSHGGDGGHDPHDLTIGLGVLGGILAFLVVEKVVRLLQGDSGHGHSHGAPKKTEDKPKSPKKGKEEEEKTPKSPKKGKKKEKDSDAEEEKEEKTPKKKEEEKPKKKEEEEPQEDVQVAGYLNLFADFFHNFTDGLAIGASFLAGNSIGVMTTFTILFHEIPHEIGDYAILIQSGVKPFKAKCLQLLTAVGAFCGCVVSLLWSGADQAANAYILPFTAGGFIYIATVSVIPELLEGKSTAKQSLMEIAALVVGVYMMVVITWYE